MGHVAQEANRRLRQVDHRPAEHDAQTGHVALLMQKAAQGIFLVLRKELAAIPRRACGAQVHHKYAQIAV